MPKRAASGLYVANTTFLADGYTVVKGRTLVRAGATIMKGREECFDPVESRLDHDVVEQATAAPGERRETARHRETEE